eukprot:CAMPEP_0174842888 /NCGR_PEP_ID=MMETSP1114-20130205/10177_1 /TAXON_ID=312471 /ORGANISM="Neobodo designis, Strain CCAP 1951/1" /LENGTH=702 /DNA_ID=CAMNT_0016077099 /DNA_START=83 /DNA_END=2187 /DNA_ORIENTATION=+
MWKPNSLLLTELVDEMASLYKVMQQAHSNNPEVQFVVAVPPDESLPRWAVLPSGRVSQAFVRSHIFRLRGGTAVHELRVDPADPDAVVSFRGLSENIVATLSAASTQVELRQTATADADEEARELFGDDIDRVIADEKREHARDVAVRQNRGRLSVAGSLGESSRVRQSASSQAFAVRTGPLDAVLRLRTSWTTRERTVRTYAAELVRNASATGKRASSEPFMLLLFVDEPVYCELDWAGIEPGTASRLSADAAAQASIRHAIKGETAAPNGDSGAAVDDNPRAGQSWLGDLFAEIAYAVPKPVATETRREASTNRDGDEDLSVSGRSDSATAVSSPQPSARETTRSNQETRMRRVSRAMPRTFEAAPMCRALLTLLDSDVADAVLLRLDTEAVIFESTYVCVPGYEEFTVAKVNAIVEALTQDFIRDVNAKTSGSERPVVATPKRDGTASEEDAASAVDSPATYPRKLPEEAERGLSETGIRDNDVDVVVTAIHAITTAAFAPVLVPHWRDLHESDDTVFHRQCLELGVLLDKRRDPRNDSVANASVEFSRGPSAPVIDTAQHTQTGRRIGREDAPPPATMFGMNVRSVPEQALEPAIHLLREFDNAFSVFTYMRVAERALTVAMQVMAAEGFPLTADISIPVLMYLLVRAAPRRLRSTVAFVTAFRLEALDMSALGYSFTTVEAAAHQLDREHDELVAAG